MRGEQIYSYMNKLNIKINIQKRSTYLEGGVLGFVAKFFPQLPRENRARSWRGSRFSRTKNIYVIRNYKFAEVRDRALKPRFVRESAVTSLQTSSKI
ncbi:MAG: hypothetical protein A3I24_03445 [Candidatus Harrisonbacteria bacterium RIFCSPLOWO2_02_FULL_41_13b]|uniref:Uncharacterized protein n=1 Tax=Candidatus Harrisonbacteria bacterium RIFCSPLOWO2_02_FULL_41_13b TaxID=1798409 RepID=A0A1G1ZQI6_9BACT|nr:MAG: hypothetical protein A3J53_01380 [Candidatus Harrisonbacteria bacterium RIFCSPHIGHO2_02_FULL_40_20]OGY66705.1 MAG: hypothetical protein A3I24_03445 [Candidatus Harrisonbacteria bacterium RIFCSPLOWO2_02_FULL_41_13b]